MIVNIITVLLFAVTLKANDQCKRDIRWEDFSGPIPENALNVAANGDGNHIYIGSTEIFGQPVEGVIPHFSQGTMNYVNYGEVLYHSENIKILCTDHPENFKWNDDIADEGYHISAFDNRYFIRDKHTQSLLGVLTKSSDGSSRVKPLNDAGSGIINTYDILSYIGCDK